jgi:hypothetical protein
MQPIRAAFDKSHHPTSKLLGGGQGIPIAEFLQAPASHWLDEKNANIQHSTSRATPTDSS